MNISTPIGEPNLSALSITEIVVPEAPRAPKRSLIKFRSMAPVLYYISAY